MWFRDMSGPARAGDRRARLLALVLLGCLSGCVNLDRPEVGLLDGPPPTDRMVVTDAEPQDAPADTDPTSDATMTPTRPIPTRRNPTPDLAPDIMPLANGRACATASQCESGQCVDAVCCESACDGVCRSCNATGSEGRCTMVSAGEDPGNDCPQDPLAMCQRDGTCNGAGSCRLYTAGTECAAGRCQTTTEFAASTCDGAGTCRAGASRTCPGGGTCMGTSCGSSCSTDGNCQTGFFCDQNVCRAKRSRGAACTGPAQCASGFCADGVCCATACTETCHACNAGSNVGTCTPVAAGQDPRNVCPTDPAASCARNGACNGAGACQFYAAGSSCGSSTCSGTTETPAATCNGLGTCTPAAARDCGGFTCGGSACYTSCSSGAQCNAGYSCAGTSCQPLGGLVLYWRLDELSGTTALDSSGAGRNGVYYSGTGPTPATATAPVRFGNPRSRMFDNASRHAIRLASMPSALKPVNTLSLSAWYRTNTIDIGENTDSSEIISGGDNYILRVRADGFEFSVGTSMGHVKCLMPVTGHLDNAWHHVAGVLTSTGLKGYYNGVERCSVSGNFDITYTRGTDFWVGRHGDTDVEYDYDGNLDDVRVYNRGLSAAEIVRLAQGHSQQ